jgi:hypothetical protein
MKRAYARAYAARILRLGLRLALRPRQPRRQGCHRHGQPERRRPTWTARAGARRSSCCRVPTCSREEPDRPGPSRRPAIICGVDVVLSVPLFAGFALVAVVALVLLKKSPLYWLPGVAVIGYGVAIYVAWPWYDTHGAGRDHDGTGFEGLSNLLHVAVSLVVASGGAVCLIVGARSRQRARRARRTDIPTAIVMKDSR